MADLNLDDLLYECRTLEEKCLYSAQGHYETAKEKKDVRIKCVVIPAVVSAVGASVALLGGLIPATAQTVVALLTVLAAIVTALSALFEVDGQSSKHLYLGHQFNALMLEVNRLHRIEALMIPLSEAKERFDLFFVEYQVLVKTSDLTDQKAFERARKAIQGGLHRPDESAPLKLREQKTDDYAIGDQRP